MTLLRCVLAALLIAAASGAARASTHGMCERTADISAAQQDQVLRFAAAVKHELDASGQNLALVSRSGTDLTRFGLLYSHAGLALKANPAGPWAVRQLYYACEEAQPHLFDQGMAGFALGADQPETGHIALVFLPPGPAAELETAALNKATALSALGPTYSANAYAFSTRYQNCNQWLAELLALAWGKLTPGANARNEAQAWLRAQHYEPDPVRVPKHWMVFAAQFVPLLHIGDHPLEDLQALRLRISLPGTIEAFVRQQMPQAHRVELCHRAGQIVVHRGWDALPPDCSALPGDEILAPGP